MDNRPTDWAGNTKSVRRSPCLLAYAAVRQLWFVCAAQPHVCRHLGLCTLAVAEVVAMFLEFEQGFGRNVRISPEPMRKAVKTLKAEPSNQN